MEYVVRIHRRVAQQIAQWGLSDFMLVEVYLQLREALPGEPMQNLHRDEDGPGSLFAFEARDLTDPDFQFLFMFRVFFDEDEKHLDVVRGSYWRNHAPPEIS